MRRAVLATLLSAIPLAAVPGQAVSLPSLDGTWSVLIVTESGQCDRAYRYPIRVERGALVYLGVTGVNFSGKLERDGKVRVTISRGRQSATGTGQLSESGGSGTWSGQGTNVACHGRWEAERRQG